MDWDELNFTIICRCCKRTESGMASIFDGKAHPTYPPVTEMLRTIASLNMHENDGLPSLVCTSCLDNIQAAFKFILQLTLINEELSQMLAKRKQADADTKQCISTDSVKKENVHDCEDVPADHCYENIGDANRFHDEQSTSPTLACEVSNKALKTVISCENHKSVKSETNSLGTDEDNTNDSANLDQDADAVEPKIEIEEISSKLRAKRRKTPDAVQHASDEGMEGKESSCDLLIIPKVEDMQDFEDIDDTVPDEDYQVAVEEDCEDVDDMEEDEDYQLNVEDTNSLDSSDSEANPDAALDVAGPKSETKERKTISKLNLFKCKLCVYTCTFMCLLKTHLRTHCKDKQFVCSKCNGTFTRSYHLLIHSRKCNGELPKINKIKAAKQVLALTLQDLNDPEKLKEFYTVTEIGVQNNDDTDVNVQRDEATMNNLKQDINTPSKVKRFICTKCSGTFTKRGNLNRHWGTCNGEISKHARYKGRAPNQVISMTQQDLNDLKKVKNYYAVTEIGGRNNYDTDVDVNAQKPTSKITMFKCTLCAYTSTYSSNLRRHLQSHLKDRPFACSKCNGTYVRREHMLRHWRKCNGDIKQGRHKEKRSKQVIAMTLEDLQNPLKMKKYYTESEIDVQNNEDDEQSDN